jgi:CDP-paratose 2-epimerase
MARTVFVTGGCGFLGTQACESFRAQGWEVVAYDNLTKHELARTGYRVEAARAHTLEFLRRIGVKVVREDIRDAEALLDHSARASLIVHTAAQPAMTISWEAPRLDFETNALGTFNVLEAARLHGIPVVSCSTIHVYGSGINDTLRESETRYVREPVAIGEEHPVLTGRLTPLHASKRTLEIYSRTYAEMYGVKAAAFRYTGIYGPRQFGGEDHGWVANFAIRLLNGEPIRIFGTGKQVRDILFASDAAQAFLDYARAPTAGAYTIGGGPSCALSLVECVRLLEELSARKAELSFEPERFGDLRYFVSDTSAARRDFGFDARVGPREGLSAMLAWVESVDTIFDRHSKVMTK